MKKVFILFLSLFLVFNLNAQSTDGLVLWFPFNGSVSNETNNTKSAIVNGGQLTTDRFGVSQSACEFNGIDECINVLNSDEINLDNNSWTITLWFMSNVEEQDASLISKIYDEWESGDKALVYRGKTLCFDYHDGRTLSFLIKPNIWNFCVVTYNANRISLETFLADGKYFYMNSNTVLDIAESKDSSYIKIGSGYSTDYLRSNFFNGKIDDIRIYNRNLSIDELTDLYRENPPVVNVENPYAKSAFFNATSIQEVKNEIQKLDFYPNPVHNVINIDSNMKTIEIYNISGIKQNIINDNYGKIDVSSLMPGMYIIKAENYDGDLFSNKFIKQQ